MAFRKKTGNSSTKQVNEFEEKDEEKLTDATNKSSPVQETYIKAMVEMMSSMKQMMETMKKNNDQGSKARQKSDNGMPDMVMPQRQDVTPTGRRPNYVLCNIGPNKRFQQFYLELAPALQAREESALRKGLSKGSSSTEKGTKKPFIMFAQTKYAKKITKKIFSRSEQDKNCWNVVKSEHRFSKCCKNLDISAISARKAQLMENKYEPNATKRTPYGFGEGGCRPHIFRKPRRTRRHAV